MASYDPAALFGESEGAAAAPEGGSAFDVAFDDFIAAYESGDTESARIAFKEAVQACYAEESAPDVEADIGAALGI